MSLIAHFPLDGTLEDISGNNHTITNYGATINNKGKIGKCYEFDGISNYMHLDKNIELSRINSSICFWINFNNVSLPMNIFGNSSTTGTTNMLEYRSTKFYTETVINCNYFDSPTITPFQANIWKHVSVVFRDSLSYWYIDGILIGSTPNYGMYNCDGSKPLNELAGNFILKYIGSGGYSSFLNGKMNDLRVYDNALSSKEIYDISKAKILHYKFNNFEEPTINKCIKDGQDGVNPINGDGGLINLGMSTSENFRGMKVAEVRIGTTGNNFYINGSAIGTDLLSKEWTSTMYIKRVDELPITSLSTYLYVSNNPNVNTPTQIEKVENGWYKVVRTRAGLNSGHTTLFGCYGLLPSIKYYIASWQIEPKNHTTEYTPTFRNGEVKDSSGFGNHATLLSAYDSIEFKFGGAIGAPYGRDQYTMMGHIAIIGEDGVDYGLNSNGATWTASSTHTVGMNVSNIGVDNGDEHHMTNTGDKWYKCTLSKEVKIKEIYFKTGNSNGTYSYQDTPKNMQVYFATKSRPDIYSHIEKITLSRATAKNQIYGNIYPFLIAQTPKWTSDSKIGTGAYDFGTGDLNDIKIKTEFQDLTDSITVSCWVYQVNNGQNDNPMITFSESVSFSTGWALWNGYSSDMRWYINGNGGSTAISGMYDSWHHYVGTYNSVTGTSKMYFDGELKQTIELGAGTLIKNSSRDLYIGEALRNGNQSLSGKIDDVGIYATELSQEDILRLYQSRFNVDNKGKFSLNELNTVEKEYYNSGDGEYNLVKNGNMQLKNNDNFTNLSYIDDVRGRGLMMSGRYHTQVTDEVIEFDFRDKQKKIDISFTLKNVSGNGRKSRHYTGIQALDKHKRYIQPKWVYLYSGTETTLSQNLNNGDTVVHLTSSNNWRDSAISPYGHLAIYDNFEYPIYKFTDKTFQQKVGLPVGNTIELNSPYSGNTILAGTAVAQTHDGGYDYYASSNEPLNDDEEKTYTTTLDHTRLRYGTKYIKPLMLLSRPYNPSVDGSSWTYDTLVKDVTFRGKYGDFEKDHKVSFKENGICGSNVDEIGMTEGLVGYWKFNDLSDYSNEENNLRNFGVSLSGGTAEFDGVSALTVPHNDSLNLDYITMINVIKIDGSKLGQTILFNKENSYTTTLQVETGVATYQSAIYSTIGTGSWAWVGNMNIPLNEWVFVATVWNGQKVSNYVNDQKVEVNNTNNKTGTINHNPGYGLGLGSRGVPADGSTKGQNFFKGNMKESRIYNRILTEDEVFTLYKIMMKDTANIKNNVFYVNEINEV